MNPKNTFTQQAQSKPSFSLAVTSPTMQGMIKKALGSDAAAARVTSTLISAVNASEQLRNCEASTIVAAALRGEGLGLIYGHGYYVVPYGTVATYIMSYKGYIQLAMSTGFYADIDCIEVRDGELDGRDRRTGKPKVNLAKYETDEEREQHAVIGYYGYSGIALLPPPIVISPQYGSILAGYSTMDRNCFGSMPYYYIVVADV